MAVLNAHGIEAALPAGCGGRIFVRSAAGGAGASGRAGDTAGDGAAARPVAQFATFAIDHHTPDFGGSTAATMRPSDVFTVLFEYGPESVGRALFAHQGMPRDLRAEHFKPFVLRRGNPAQSGSQWFFTEAGRPFTLYAVVGSHALRHVLVPKVNAILATVRILS
jgi:hypothetical protein